MRFARRLASGMVPFAAVACMGAPGVPPVSTPDGGMATPDGGMATPDGGMATPDGGMATQSDAKRGGAPNVTVDTQKTYQTWYAWTTLSRRWDAPHMVYGPEQGVPLERVPEADKTAMLDYLYSELELDGIEVPLVGGNDGAMDPSYQAAGHDWRSHERQNDNADPKSYQASPGEFDYWGPHLAIVKAASARIEARGQSPVIGLRVGNVPEWMTALHDTQTATAEYAEWVIALLDYFGTEGVSVSYVSLQNEPEGNGVGPDLLAARGKALAARLDELGLDVSLAGPETVTPEDADSMGYLAALESTGVASELTLVSYHSYDQDASVGIEAPLASRQKLASFAAKYGAATFFSEQSSDVKANRRTYWNDTPEQALQWAIDVWREMTVTQMAAYCQMWNVWTNNNSNFGTDPFALLEVGPAPDYAYLGWKKPLYNDTLGAFIQTIRPGMVRVEASTGVAGLLVVAFVDAAQGELAVVAVNTGTNPVEVTLPNGVSGTAPAAGAVGLVGPLP